MANRRPLKRWKIRSLADEETRDKSGPCYHVVPDPTIRVPAKYPQLAYKTTLIRECYARRFIAFCEDIYNRYCKSPGRLTDKQIWRIEQIIAQVPVDRIIN